VTGDVVGTDQYSVRTVPSSSWKTATYNVPAGVAPTFGTSCAVNAPSGPIVTARLPAATASPSAVWNDGHEISTVPDAAVPSARYTVLLTVVSAGPCACNGVDSAIPISSASIRESATSAAFEKRLLFNANDLGISSSLLVSTCNPDSDQ